MDKFLLEYPTHVNDSIQVYLDSNFQRKDKNLFFEIEPWMRKTNDGRTSQIKFDMLGQIGTYKKNYQNLIIKAWIDYTLTEKENNHNIDDYLAKDLRRLYDDNKDALIVIFIGNYHSNQRR